MNNAKERSLSDADKFGLIIQCRQNMDELKIDELKEFGKSMVEELTLEQLKTFFVLWFECDEK